MFTRKESAGLRRLSAALESKPLPRLSALALRTLGNQHTPELDYVPANRSATGRREWRAVCACGHRPDEGTRSVDDAMELHAGHLRDVIVYARQNLARLEDYQTRTGAL
jgi:hypothetical protein